ncbi:MAG TPA: molybdenum cofactor guanylyltransferase [Rhizomicrobium sp.]|jgi:molybdopterin-guanine dinucleotide biosynthesis protein A|nr:molybdenum cofactor guanylyltransferase [Rhizomicrobium sp.]
MAGVTIDGVILAGGASARMGGQKALAPFRGATLIEAVIARARPQLGRLALDAPKDSAELYRARFGDALPILPDLYADRGGPLCGIATGLSWTSGDWLAVFPCDTPFLPLDLIAQLLRHARSAPVVARNAQVCGLWPKSCLDAMKEGLDDGRLRSVLSAVEFFGGAVVDIDASAEAFFNVNTPEDLKKAEGLRPSPAP